MSWYSVVVTVKRGGVTRELKIDSARDLSKMKPFLFDLLIENLIDIAQSRLLLNAVETHHEMSSVSYVYNNGQAITITRKYHESD